MTPGELDQLITIQRETKTDDGMGGQDVTLTDLAADLWAKVRELSGREVERHGQLEASAMVTFIIRNEIAVQADDRIVWNGDTYNIRYIAPTSSRDQYQRIEAEKGVAQ